MVNIITGFGNIAGAAIASHMKISKVAFTGSTLVGRTIMKAAANSNLKNVTLELGGKVRPRNIVSGTLAHTRPHQSPNIVFDDADLEAAAGWGAFGLFFNGGQVCSAGSRIFVQETIYDQFLALLTKKVESLELGSPFAVNTFQGPQSSKLQHDRIMAHIQSGKDEGATVHTGGERHGTEGFFIQPTIFTDVKPNMVSKSCFVLGLCATQQSNLSQRILKEEIFGPVAVVIKFKDEADSTSDP